MADDEVANEPGVDTPPARMIAVSHCLPNPRNPRDELGDLSDLRSIKDRQLQSCLAITPTAYLRLWPQDRKELGAGPDDVVIINGNRRRAAAEKYGRPELLVVVDDGIATSRASVLRAAYDENTGRADFDPIEEAKAVMEIVSEYTTAKEAAAAEGWSQPWISHRKNLLKLHPELQREVRAKARGADGLSINVARRLGAVKGISEMELGEQRQALADLLRADAEASEGRKEVRRKVRRELEAQPPTPSPEPSESAPAGRSESVTGAGGVLSTSQEFSAENSSGGVPEQRAADTEAVPAVTGATDKAAAKGDEEPRQRQVEASPPAGVPISALVTPHVAATFEKLADLLSRGHRVPLTASDVLGFVAEFAAQNGTPSLQLLSGRIESRYSEPLDQGAIRFTWHPLPGSENVRVAERQFAGHPSSDGVSPRCTAPTEGEPCEELVIWKVQDDERGTFYYCDKDLPAEETPPGLWRG
ncbi:hypothetical protein [Streptomyces sp. NPDC096153]|uniref:ParB/RepB/Spo0J family partition protein n=1 Tax=Streptomyces sp. NPDC096153 TaxID=3155548 RepID=UPI0033314A12